MATAAVLQKAPTGVPGLDENMRGGLPRGRATLFGGGTGSGKSLLALQSLVNGARRFDEPGIFVSFEEDTLAIRANTGKFLWDLGSLSEQRIFFLDAQPSVDLVQSGGFDLDGLLAGLANKAAEIGARRIVFDALDVVLALMNDPAAERHELYKLHDWLRRSGLTAIITAKQIQFATYDSHIELMQFMVDCVVSLNHAVVEGVSQRNMRIVKYRGSDFEENEAPFVIGNHGIEVAAAYYSGESRVEVSNERISTGIQRLDTMLSGGYYRCASVLITGFPGTAKTTLCGAFAQAACERGEPTLFVSYDSDVNEIIRNLSSVNIQLRRFVDSGMLFSSSAQTIGGSAEIHFMRVRELALGCKARCLVIDPVSSLAKAGNQGTVRSVMERLLDWAKSNGITLVCTSLLDGVTPRLEGTPIQISTVADTWIHLSYLVHGGERNRSLSIMKSRGTFHSNQTRELVLSSEGVTLADAYMAGGEVLMGTLRWEKEQAERAARAEAEAAIRRQIMLAENEESELTTKIKSLQRELELKHAERDMLAQSVAIQDEQNSRDRQLLRVLRSADPADGDIERRLI